eukprot:2638113-Rhodomonas_salina.1
MMDLSPRRLRPLGFEAGFGFDRLCLLENKLFCVRQTLGFLALLAIGACCALHPRCLLHG